MNDDNVDINSYEQWVLDNMDDNSIKETRETLDDFEPEKNEEESFESENEESSEDEEDIVEESDLERLRGDSTRHAKISTNRQSQLVIKILMGMLIIFVFLALFIKSQFNPVVVVGPSMDPTLKNGDVLRTSVSFNEEMIRYDSIICFKKNSPETIIKRVVGRPGDTISFKGGKVLINGIVRDDGFPLMKEYPKKSIVLKDDEFYCLGDNRNKSVDSRVFGPVKFSEITNLVRFNQTGKKVDFEQMYNVYQTYQSMDIDKATSTDAIEDILIATPSDSTEE